MQKEAERKLFQLDRKLILVVGINLLFPRTHQFQHE